MVKAGKQPTAFLKNWFQLFIQHLVSSIKKSCTLYKTFSIYHTDFGKQRISYNVFGAFGSGTTLCTGLVDFKYAKIAFRSSSVRFLKFCHGIGGNKFRFASIPLYLPWRMAVKNCASVQLPIPVESLVIFAENDMPQGPTAEVRSPPNNIQPFF